MLNLRGDNMTSQDNSFANFGEDSPSDDAFAHEVEIALEHFHDPTWLGQHSALAAPYFLVLLCQNHRMRVSRLAASHIVSTMRR